MIKKAFLVGILTVALPLGMIGAAIAGEAGGEGHIGSLIDQMGNPVHVEASIEGTWDKENRAELEEQKPLKCAAYVAGTSRKFNDVYCWDLLGS